MWRSALFRSRTRLTREARSRSSAGSRSVTSLWTVLLLTPKTLAASRTVAWVRAMYSLTSRTRLWMCSFTAPPPLPGIAVHLYARGGEKCLTARSGAGRGAVPAGGRAGSAAARARWASGALGQEGQGVDDLPSPQQLKMQVGLLARLQRGRGADAAQAVTGADGVALGDVRTRQVCITTDVAGRVLHLHDPAPGVV